MDPNYAATYRRLGEAYEQKGMYETAIRSLEKAKALSPTPGTIASLGHVYARAGRRSDALRMLEELTTTSGQEYVSAFPRAVIYVGLGDRERAFESLDRAYQHRYPWLIYLKNEARLDPLRDDPRFSELLRRIGLDRATGGGKDNEAAMS